MSHLLDVVVMGRACRNTAAIKNRQPIARMFVKAPWRLSEFYTDIIGDELNVKKVEFADDIENFISTASSLSLRQWDQIRKAFKWYSSGSDGAGRQ